jgi:hypothetical protein
MGSLGFLFGVCDDALWALLNTSPEGVMRDRPDFPEPAALATGAGPAARDAFKRATESRSAWLAYSAFFCVALLESIVGASKRLSISDPLTDPLHLSPRDIINAMTVSHGAMTDAEVDALRLPLKKNLSSVSDLPAHIVAFKFRGVLAQLTIAGQAPITLDAFRLFLAALSPFPVFHQYTLLFTVAHEAVAQQTFEAYAAYIIPQHHNILAHSNPQPFPGNLEGFERVRMK